MSFNSDDRSVLNIIWFLVVVIVVFSILQEYFMGRQLDMIIDHMNIEQVEDTINDQTNE